METTSKFHEAEVLHSLSHYLPAQAPLKDFIHHNTLHAFQKQHFFEGIRTASELFGYKVSLSIAEYQALYTAKKINELQITSVLARRKGANASEWRKKLFSDNYVTEHPARVGRVRSQWRTTYGIDLDAIVHPTLFRLLCSYLDQGISIWAFPNPEMGLLAAVREMEAQSFISFFRHPQAKQLLANPATTITEVLDLLVGNEELYGHYIFDQQFAHAGWSGMVAAIETAPKTLLDQRTVSLHDLVLIELLLELDALNSQLADSWQPLGRLIDAPVPPFFAPVPTTELAEVLALWQEAYEWSFYDEVLKGIQANNQRKSTATAPSFQALFCIDDRECSFRRYLEQLSPNCQTFGTPGFFGIDCYYQPMGGKFVTKICPAPLQPNHVIEEVGGNRQHQQDRHFSKHAHSFHSGWLISQTLGFWSAFKLFLNIFRPQISPASASSFQHMDIEADLSVEHTGKHHDTGLQVGYTIEEMTDRVESVLRSIGLIDHFAPIVYAIGHGASSVNNPHYAAYDCGACSGRAGSVNARVFSDMANRAEVRRQLADRGIHIPNETQFVGGLRDTTRDDIHFFDEALLTPTNAAAHAKHLLQFDEASKLNAKERSRRFESIDSAGFEGNVHEEVRRRSVSLFEPRPELNHATNTLCIIAPRALTKGVFLDRRAFLNSYDYRTDPDGTYLTKILGAAAPVCGGINLEYYFSRVDNQKLGAGSKLPHNVMGLFGVANGIEGDLRPGLPSQMIEVHDPLRLLMVIEQQPDVVQRSISANKATYEWFANEWVRLVVLNPIDERFYLFENEEFTPYTPSGKEVLHVPNLNPWIEAEHGNLPVFLLN